MKLYVHEFSFCTVRPALEVQATIFNIAYIASVASSLQMPSYYSYFKTRRVTEKSEFYKIENHRHVLDDDCHTFIGYTVYRACVGCLF
jgi:hypothetical protein